jgi:hypothetical protein
MSTTNILYRSGGADTLRRVCITARLGVVWGILLVLRELYIGGQLLQSKVYFQRPIPGHLCSSLSKNQTEPEWGVLI